MIIFIDEDEAYLRWIDENPGGFVVNSLRRPAPVYLKVHRATCAHISTDKRSNWTGPDYVKVVSASLDELKAWALHEVGGRLQSCAFCLRTAVEPESVVADPHSIPAANRQSVTTSVAAHDVAPKETGSAIDVICKGVILGTPRTYGDRVTEDIWRRAIMEGNWERGESLSTLQIPLHLEFAFRVNPRSPLYRRRVSSNGPDLDTMVIGALGGLLRCRNPERPTLRLIQHGGLCRLIKASKCLVDDDQQAGFTLHVRPGDSVAFEEPPNTTGLSFYVNCRSLKKDRRRSVQEAAEQANRNGFRAPKGSQIEINLAFAEGLTRNPVSADWLEAIIDGLGASQVGTAHFFDGPPTQEFGYDDSVVFRLTCAHVQGLPPEAGLHLSCALLESGEA